MKKKLSLTALLLLYGLSILTADEPAIIRAVSSDKAVHITIIYDNYLYEKDLKTDWGFACLVEYKGNQLLFDAGRSSGLYQENMSKLQIDPKEIPTLFISHAHGDHTAGVPWITQVNPFIKCYLPSPYAKLLKANGTLPPNSQTITEPTHLYGPFYSTGDSFKAFTEQGLLVKTENGGVLITGCGHPGAVPMIDIAEEKLGIKVHTVIGGLHLMQKSGADMDQLASTLKKMGIKQICPTHCTGDKSIASLGESFGEGYISGGAGKEIIVH